MTGRGQHWEKNRSGKGDELFESGNEETAGVGGLKVLVIYSQEVCSLNLGIAEKLG